MQKKVQLMLNMSATQGERLLSRAYTFLCGQLLSPSLKTAVFLGLFSFVLAAVGELLVHLLVETSDRRLPSDTSISAGMIFSLVVVAPIIETLLSQTLVIGVLQKLRVSVWLCIAVSSLAFTLPHFVRFEVSFSWFIQVIPLAVSGLLFASVFVGARTVQGIFLSTCYTALVHMIHNTLVAVLLLIYLSQLSG